MDISNYPRGINYIAVPNKKNWFRLTKDYPFTVDGVTETIPKGYEWDGATKPRFTWVITGYYPTGKMAEPSVVHDWIYIHKGILPNSKYTRSRCDKLFYKHMLLSGVTPRMARLMFRIVRVFGLYYWRSIR